MADKSQYRSIFRASTVGIGLVVATFVGFAIGHYLDNYFGTTPWLTIIFFFIGLATGFRDLFRLAKRSLDDDTE